jgi:hypothetical protein
MDAMYVAPECSADLCDSSLGGPNSRTERAHALSRNKRGSLDVGLIIETQVQQLD